MNLIFAGTPTFAATHLEACLASRHQVIAVITQPDKPGKRGKKPVPSPVKVLAESHGIPVLQPQKLSHPDIENLAPDLLVVVAYGQILRAKVLSVPKYGCVNVHASLLPRWRGAAPIHRAILAGDQETGICVMQMDEGLDTGAVILRHAITISPTETTGTLTNRLAETGSKELVAALDLISSGTVEPLPQPEEGVTYANKITKVEARIDWRQPAEFIDRQVRAHNPDLIAYTECEGLRVKVWEAVIGTVVGQNSDHQPGEIISVTKDGLVVACGTGTIRITRLQLPVGKGNVIGIADLMNARRSEFTVGKCFSLTEVASDA